MSSFAFGFTFENELARETNQEEQEQNEISRDIIVTTEYESRKNTRQRRPIHILNMDEKCRNYMNISNVGTRLDWKYDVLTIPGGHDSLKRIHPVEKPFEALTKTNHRIDNNSDLISGVYEGGLKVWECSIDLCNYMAEKSSHVLDRICSVPGGGSVLELGCGRKYINV